MRPILHTYAYRPESKLFKTDGDRQTMFRIGPVHARDNGPGVSVLSQNVLLGTKTYYMPEQE